MALKTENKSLNKVLSSAQNRTYVVTAITVIVATLMIIFAIMPAYISITDKKAENKAKEEYITELDRYLADLGILFGQLTEYKDEVELLNFYYPNTANSELYLANLDAIAKKYDCSVMSVSFTKNATNHTTSKADMYGTIQRVPITFTIIGDLSDMQLFLVHLEKLPMIIKIESISYTAEGLENYVKITSDNANNYIMSITAEYFYWDFKDIQNNE